MAERLTAAVAVVEGFPGDGIAVNRSTAALLDAQACFPGLAVLGLGHGWVGIEGRRMVMSDRRTMHPSPCSCHAFVLEC